MKKLKENKKIKSSKNRKPVTIKTWAYNWWIDIYTEISQNKMKQKPLSACGTDQRFVGGLFWKEHREKNNLSSCIDCCNYDLK